MRWVVTGPESSGKSMLSEALASECGLILISEYARDYLKDLNRAYTPDDLKNIALHQIDQWKKTYKNPPVFDTDILTTMIWHLEKYGNIPSFMMEHWLNQRGTIYLLCKPDIPWEADPLRENPNDRARLFHIYFHYLNAYGKSFKIVAGQGKERLSDVFKIVKRISPL